VYYFRKEKERKVDGLPFLFAFTEHSGLNDLVGSTKETSPVYTPAVAENKGQKSLKAPRTIYRSSIKKFSYN
jgi:hypothetical protein